MKLEEKRSEAEQNESIIPLVKITVLLLFERKTYSSGWHVYREIRSLPLCVGNSNQGKQ